VTSNTDLFDFYEPAVAAGALADVALAHAAASWRRGETRDAAGVASAIDRLMQSESGDATRQLLVLVAGARLCSDRLRNLELAAARAARGRGVSIRQLAQAADIAERSAADRYGRPKVLVSTDPAGYLNGAGVYGGESCLVAILDLLAHNGFGSTPVASEDHGRPGEGQIFALQLDDETDAGAVGDLLEEHFYDVERESGSDDY
jgi:hypothetical protein